MRKHQLKIHDAIYHCHRHYLHMYVLLMVYRDMENYSTLATLISGLLVNRWCRMLHSRD